MSDASFATHSRIALSLYWSAAKKATRATARNWIIPLASIAAYLFFLFLTRIVANIPGSGGGFTPQGLVLGLIMSALLALYYSWLDAASKEQTVHPKELLRMDGSLFFAILGVGFALWVLSLILSILFGEPGSNALLLACRFGIFMAFNAVSEMIYIQRRDGVDALRESLLFLKENWIEWFIPMLLFLLPAISVIGTSIFYILVGGDPLLPPLILLNALLLYLGVKLSISGYLLVFLGVVIVTWFMIFRGFLFRVLSTSSRRSRLFKLRQ